MGKHIICPNCGATNDIIATECQFCGASLMEVPVEEISRSPVSIQKFKGRPQIKLDERIFELKYDVIKDVAKVELQDYIWKFFVGSFVLGWEYSACRNSGGFVYYFYEKRFEILHLNAILNTGKSIKLDFDSPLKISKKGNLDILESLCELSDCFIIYKMCDEGYSGRFGGFVNKEGLIIFVLICRVFYNAFFDKAKYVDAADKLYESYLQSDFYRKKVEWEERKKREEIEAEKRRIEEEEQKKREEIEAEKRRIEEEEQKKRIEKEEKREEKKARMRGIILVCWFFLGPILSLLLLFFVDSDFWGSNFLFTIILFGVLNLPLFWIMSKMEDARKRRNKD